MVFTVIMAVHTTNAQVSIPTQITQLTYQTDTTIDYPYKHYSPGFVPKSYNIFNTSDASLRRSYLQLIQNLYDSILPGIGGSKSWSDTSKTWSGNYIQNGNGYGINMTNFLSYRWEIGSVGWINILDSTAKWLIKGHDSTIMMNFIDKGASASDSIKIGDAWYLTLSNGNAGQALMNDGNKHSFWSSINILGFVTTYNGTATQGNGLKVIRVNNDATGQTGALSSVSAYAVPALETFEVEGYVNITAISVDVLEFVITWTDENNNSQQMTVWPNGGTSALLSTTGYYSFSPITIRAHASTAITVKTTLATGGGSITYDIGALITQVN